MEQKIFQKFFFFFFLYHLRSDGSSAVVHPEFFWWGRGISNCRWARPALLQQGRYRHRDRSILMQYGGGEIDRVWRFDLTRSCPTSLCCVCYLFLLSPFPTLFMLKRYAAKSGGSISGVLKRVCV